MGDTLKKSLLGVAAGAALAISGTAAMADGPVCSKSRLTGIAAVNGLNLPDGGFETGWFGTGHGQAPPDKPTAKGVEGDVGCAAKKLSDLEAACFKEWRKAYCP